MFAQANSEHCRHKIFNADWLIDGEPAPKSLFAMIRNTHARPPGRRAVGLQGQCRRRRGRAATRWFWPNPRTGVYGCTHEPVHILMKVETHNHPTAISPFPGAATGSGGEIRDEGATGRGAKPKAGLVGFTVSHLAGAGLAAAVGSGRRSASPTASRRRSSIMLDGPDRRRRASTTSSAGRHLPAISARSSAAASDAACGAAITSPS